ncbi:DUF4129 domain-containing protein [Zunongwangia sp.]|uniref:DUF4129 domain-containing protein n=1 Tax=Zunongwangia sp. TaxID=1965325 RepID=UPI003AA8C68B
MKLLQIFVVLFIGFSSWGQQPLVSSDSIRYDHSELVTPKNLDKQQIKNYQKDKEFQYIQEKQEKNWWQRFKEWLIQKLNQLASYLFEDYETSGLIATILKIIPYIILGFVLWLIVWLFMRLSPSVAGLDSVKKSTVNLNADEDIIKNADIQQLIKNAVENKQYRLAVRYYYLQVLKELDNLHFINYENQKTNEEYSSELKNEQLNTHFKKTTRIYNFIWYGDFSVSETDFKLAQKNFNELKSILKTTSNE